MNPSRRYLRWVKRAAIGLQLRATGTRRDTLGVFVDAVTPKGPAEAAGIIEGDRIAAIGLHAIAAALGNHRGTYHDAVFPAGRQVPMDPEPARPRFIART